MTSKLKNIRNASIESALNKKMQINIKRRSSKINGQRIGDGSVWSLRRMTRIETRINNKIRSKKSSAQRGVLQHSRVQNNTSKINAMMSTTEGTRYFLSPFRR